MMSEDYERFVEVIQTLSAVYGKELDDDQLKFYWESLKDRPLPDIEQRATRYGMRGKFFPKPRDLRPVDSDQDEPRREDSPASRARFDQLERENIAAWDERLRADPLKTKLMLCVALEARYSVEENQGSLMLAEKRQWLARRRRELIDESIKAGRPELVLSDLTTWTDVLASEGGARQLDKLEDLAVKQGAQCKTPFLGRSHFYPVAKQATQQVTHQATTKPEPPQDPEPNWEVF